MSHVDPVIVPVPVRWREDPEIGPFMDYMMRFWHDLWVRTGAGDDYIANQSIREVFPWTIEPDTNDFDTNDFSFARLPEFSQFYVISTATNHTTTGNEMVVVTAEATISLNATPDDMEAVNIKHAATGPVTISGNGKTIDGKSSLVMYTKYTSPHLIYSVDAGEWLIV